jgi:hypothetical protein
MPRYPSFPPLFNEALSVSITSLKEWGYLEPNQNNSGIITWSINGHKTGSISIRVITSVTRGTLILDYRYRDSPVCYSVNLISMPSNLGKGIVWLFECPHTKKLCRKLYSVGEWFLHREAFIGCMYEKQTYSKSMRDMGKVFEKYFSADNAYEKIYSKHFKKYYRGIPTKKYQKLLTKAQL